MPPATPLSTTRRPTAREALRMFTTRGWLAFHLVVAALAVTMILLGRWQLHVSDRKGFDLQNFSYVIQWWAFTAFGLFMWLRVIRDRWRKAKGTGPDTAASSAGQVVARRPGSALAGPALLTSIPTKPGEAPVVYRGYVMPNSAARPVRSHGDTYLDAYNDHLWELSLAEQRVLPRSVRADPTQGSGSGAGEPSAPRLAGGDDSGAGDGESAGGDESAGGGEGVGGGGHNPG